MNPKLGLAALTAAIVMLCEGCTRIETGEVGLRINLDRTTDAAELLPGSFNKTLRDEILTFKLQDVWVWVGDMPPLSSDNFTVKDFDMTIV